MSRPKTLMNAESVAAAKRDLKRLPNGIVATRLQAILACADHPVSLVAEIFHVSPRTLTRWMHNYLDGGVEGLRDRPKGHYPSKLTKEQRAQVFTWLDQGRDAQGRPTLWTIARLQEAIREEFNVSLSHTPVWKMIRKMGFRLRKPRPRHKKADRKAQEAFKKNP